MLWFVNYNPTGFRKRIATRINLDRNACPTIMALGIYGDWRSNYWLEEDGIMPTTTQSNKPPYRVPSIAEINAIPWNGLNVVSTFSGCGGSCLGYRMAGYRVVWANEFVPIAQESYRANASPYSYLDGRDIHIITADEILAQTGLKRGELDLFDGSPPCQAFSTAGKREKGWGQKKTYEHGASQCNETLFDEYIRLLRGLQPKVFVAENVSGLIKGTAKGFFIEILTALKACGYRVKATLLDAQWLGVPQMRQRIIFMGVRNDLGFEPLYPSPFKYRYSVRDALPWISSLRLHGDKWGPGNKHVSPAIGASDAHRNGNAQFSAGGWVEEAPQLHMAAHGFFPGRIVDLTNEPAPTVLTGGFGAGAHLTGANNQDAEQLEDLSIERFAIGPEYDKLKPGEHSEKFFNLVRANANTPCGTVTAMGGSSVGTAAVCHPTEKRKFSIAELRRICAFPDDFILKGTYAQQWERLGNSVPPLMMKAIAEPIRDRLLSNRIKTKKDGHSTVLMDQTTINGAV